MSEKPKCVERKTCRICGSAELKNVIDLGAQFVASAFIKDHVPAELATPLPLEVVRCSKGCGLVQLRQTVDPALLYGHNYGYRSGTNEMMRDNLRSITAAVESLIKLAPGDTVLDIGCNDGTLLESYGTKGLDHVGFDPSSNVAAAARAKGFEVVNDFYSQGAFEKVRRGRKARVITSIAMFYDLEDPPAFVHEVAGALADDGVWVIELSYLPRMLARNSFDTICHEHLEYYALRQIEWMLEREKLQVQRVEQNEANGGSFRLFIRRAGVAFSDADRESTHKLRDSERELGLETERPYDAFVAASRQVREDLRRLLGELKAAGKSVWLYGASTKGNTLLQYAGIDPQLVVKAADRNPDKWGLRTLGTNIPIVSEDDARAAKPDYFLVLPWHFLDAFVKRETAFLARGGKFIVPFPKVRLVGG
jgi:NDP-4-keto-2,6-dideoxyhexose 3-C-methyltransferase